MSLPEDIDGYLDPLLRTFEVDLTHRLQGHLVSIYLKGAAEMTSWGRTALEAKPILFEGPPMREAINYASKHTAKLVTRMDEETKSRLRDVIANAIKEKRGVDGLARDIRKEVEDMSRYRSRMIARTETCDALEQSFMDRSKAMGVTGKRWWVFEQGDYPCADCEGNGDEGEVPIDHVFPSGHTRPPAHPNCKCALGPVMLS